MSYPARGMTKRSTRNASLLMVSGAYQMTPGHAMRSPLATVAVATHNRQARALRRSLRDEIMCGYRVEERGEDDSANGDPNVHGVTEGDPCDSVEQEVRVLFHSCLLVGVLFFHAVDEDQPLATRLWA